MKIQCVMTLIGAICWCADTHCEYILYQSLTPHSDWVNGLAYETMALSVGSSVIMSKRTSKARTPSLRKYFQPLQMSHVTLRIWPRNHMRRLQLN